MGIPAQIQKTITFPVENLGTGDTIQLILSFEVYHSDTYPQAMNAVDYGLNVNDYGTFEIEYDLEDRLLVPSELSFEVVDLDGVLDNYMFENGTVLMAGDNRFMVELKLNGVTEFIGAIQEDSMISDVGKRLIKFKASPRIDIINNQMAYDVDGVAINPFGYSWITKYSIRRLMEDIFKQVDATMVLNIKHSWLFHGVYDDDYDYIEYYDFVLDGSDTRSLKMQAKYLYFDNFASLRNTGDILRELAKAFGSYTGMVHEKKAFFKELFVYDSSNTQTLVNVLTHEKGYKYSLIDWVRIKFFTTGDNYVSGTVTNIEGRYYEDTIIPNTTGQTTGKTLYADREDGRQYIIESVLCTRINAAWLEIGRLLADFWYKYRSDIKYMRVDKFKVTGVTYDFLKDFTYNGIKYQIMRMKKNYSEGTTEIEALSLGAV